MSILAILVLLFWNETCNNVLACLKCEKMGKIRRDERESCKIRRDEPRILRDWAILILLVLSNLNQDKQKCARLSRLIWIKTSKNVLARLKRDEMSKIRRSNKDRPPVPVIQ